MNAHAHTHMYDWRAQGGVARTKCRGLVGRGGGSLIVGSKGLAYIHTYIKMKN